MFDIYDDKKHLPIFGFYFPIIFSFLNKLVKAFMNFKMDVIFWINPCLRWLPHWSLSVLKNP